MEQTEIKMFNDTVQYEQDKIWVKPLCEFFELDVRNQHKRIKNDPILGKLVGKNTPDLGFLEKNGRILLTKKGFARWIQIINPNIVRPELREKFIQYQSDIFDYLYGNYQDDERIKVSYRRLHKLERLYGLIGSEIKRVKKELHQHWNNKYMQTTLEFNEPNQIEE